MPRQVGTQGGLFSEEKGRGGRHRDLWECDWEEGGGVGPECKVTELINRKKQSIKRLKEETKKVGFVGLGMRERCQSPGTPEAEPRGTGCHTPYHFLLGFLLVFLSFVCLF